MLNAVECPKPWPSSDALSQWLRYLGNCKVRIILETMQCSQNQEKKSSVPSCCLAFAWPLTSPLLTADSVHEMQTMGANGCINSTHDVGFRV